MLRRYRSDNRSCALPLRTFRASRHYSLAHTPSLWNHTHVLPQGKTSAPLPILTLFSPYPIPIPHRQPTDQVSLATYSRQFEESFIHRFVALRRNHHRRPLVSFFPSIWVDFCNATLTQATSTLPGPHTSHQRQTPQPPHTTYPPHPPHPHSTSHAHVTQQLYPPRVHCSCTSHE